MIIINITYYDELTDWLTVIRPDNYAESYASDDVHWGSWAITVQWTAIDTLHTYLQFNSSQSMYDTRWYYN